VPRLRRSVLTMTLVVPSADAVLRRSSATTPLSHFADPPSKIGASPPSFPINVKLSGPSVGGAMETCLYGLAIPSRFGGESR